MEIEIERGVRLPPRLPRQPVTIYPWAKLRIGNSFTVSIDPEVRRKAQIAASTYKRRNPGWCYTTRLEHEDGVMRIWRTK